MKNRNEIEESYNFGSLVGWIGGAIFFLLAVIIVATSSPSFSIIVPH